MAEKFPVDGIYSMRTLVPGGDVNRSRGGYLGSVPVPARRGSASGEYSVDSYAGGYVGGKGDCATIYIPSSNYTYLGDGC